MKVLHVHSGNLYGGVETFLATLARSRHLAPSMDMTVALCFDDRVAAELRSAGVPAPILGAVRIRRLDTVRSARRALAQLLAREHFDVAVCHQGWPLAIFGPTVNAASVPLVSWIHMAQSGRHWIERLAWRIEPALIICNSRFTASTLPQTSARVEVAYAPVEGAGLAEARRAKGGRRALDTPEGDVVITQVSRMEAIKGQQVCVEALARLRDVPGWTCWQVGGPQRASEARYLDHLRSLAHRHGIAERVRFAGQRADVPDLLAASDIFCQPNLEPEGFGITFIEAMSAGLPVVTSNIGGAIEIVDEQYGVLLPPGEPGALAEVLERLIVDRAERERLGRSGQQRARALCDPAEQMRHIADLLEGVCRQHVH